MFPSPNLQIHSFTKVKKQEDVATRKMNLFWSRVTNAVKMCISFGNWHLLAGEKGSKRSEKKKTYNHQNPLHWLPSKATPTAFLQDMEPVLCLLNIQHHFKVQITKKYKQHFTKIKCFGGCFQFTSTALKIRLQLCPKGDPCNSRLLPEQSAKIDITRSLQLEFGSSSLYSGSYR